MKHFSIFPSVQTMVTLALLFSAPWVGLAQQPLPYLVGTGTQLELVGFPVHSPALDTGTVSSVGGTLVGWSPSFTDRPFGTALRAGQEYYAEVVGPTGHAWLGHRFELDEAVTKARTDHGLVAATSPLNTRGLPNSSLAGARLEVRPHLSVAGLWGETVRNRIAYGGEKDASFSFSVAAPGTPAGTRSVTASLPRLTDPLGWIDSFTKALVTQPMLMAPGTAVAVTFGQKRGSSLGFTGESRSWPTAAPLQAGVNLLAYPYPKDMRLGVDWGTSREGFRGLAKPSPAQDRIDLLAGTSRRSFAPEIQPKGGIRWRLLNPISTNARWALPASYLDTLPVGEGFILRKNRADAGHVFYPPQP
jgi:hypothetical protein